MLKTMLLALNRKNLFHSKTHEEIMTRGIPKINDVLFTTEAPLGNVCRIPAIFEKFCVGQRLITMQPINGVIASEFLEYVLLSKEFQDEMWKKSSGSTVKGIRSKELAKLTIPIPPIELQNRFADFVEQIEKQKAVMQQSLEKMETNYKALMQEYFG
jgi:type I restriction enzyme S subunit